MITVLYCLNKIEDKTEKDIMRMRNYIKKKLKKINRNTFAETAIAVAALGKSLFNRKVLLCSGAVFLICGVAGIIAHRELSNVVVSEDGLIQLTSAPMAATGKKDVISIPQGTTKANPFLPYRDISGSSTLDVPAFSLVEPPEMVDEASDAARVMDTVVSGILYDKFSPSAILNIEGNDYLVKKGDVVNNYKVVNIMQDSVTVKLGANVYKAGIGEILTEGSLNHNEVSNLNNKFGGERRQ